MRTLDAGTIGKIKDRKLTPSQERQIKVTQAVDYLFESLAKGEFGARYDDDEVLAKHS